VDSSTLLVQYEEESGDISYDSPSVYLDVYPGDEITCVFTNEAEEDGGSEGGGSGNGNGDATLIVEKIIYGADASVSFSDFSFTVDGESYQFGDEGANEITLDPGSYTVTEDYAEGYYTEYGGDCDADGNIEMLSGETYTCRVTNTLAVGGFNPDGSTPTPTPSPTPGPGGGSGGSGGTGGTAPDAAQGSSDGDVASGSAPASPSEGEGLLTASIGSLGDFPLCVPGGLWWVLLNLVLYLLALLWLQRGEFNLVKALTALVLLAAVLIWIANSCNNNPVWLPAALSVISFIWLRLRGTKAA